jgi:alpha-beta hydrolase superfamily lysophospholipase
MRFYGSLVFGGALLVFTGVAGFRAIRFLRTEAYWFHPRRGRVELPTSLSSLGTARDVGFEACDGVELRGWYFRSRNRAAIVLAHGSGADRSQLAPEARALVDDGFGVLAFDFPGHGESGGRVTYGRCETAALRAAVAFTASQADVDPERIGAIGLSSGAAILAVAAAEESRLRSIVLVSPFADSEEQTRADFAPRGRAVQWAALAVNRFYMRDGPLRPIDAVGALNGRAMLVVAAADDTVVPLWMTEKVYEAANAQKQILVLPSGGHANVSAISTGTCGRRILEFCRDTLLASTAR